MRYLKTTMLMVASFALTVLLGAAGCTDDHRTSFRGERDRYPERYERRDSYRNDDRGGISGHYRVERDR